MWNGKDNQGALGELKEKGRSGLSEAVNGALEGSRIADYATNANPGSWPRVRNFFTPERNDGGECSDLERDQKSFIEAANSRLALQSTVPQVMD